MNGEILTYPQDGIWKIERYGTHDGNRWNEVKSTAANMHLILKNMNLMLTENETLIEHISLLTNDVRMVLKNDSLGIAVIHEGVKMRKIRFKFARTNLYSGTVVSRNCAMILKKYVKVEDLSTDHGNTCSSAADSNDNDSTQVPLSQHISAFLNKNMTMLVTNKELASQFPLEEMVEICILDVNFPSLVAEVNGLLNGKLSDF